MNGMRWFIGSLLLFGCAVTGFGDNGDRPNILWITSEDNSIAWVSCYGSKNAKTPHIDRLGRKDSVTRIVLTMQRCVLQRAQRGLLDTMPFHLARNRCAVVMTYRMTSSPIILTS